MARIRTPSDLGDLIASRRRAQGLTQTELASRARVSRQWISGVEGGKPRAEIGSLLRTLDELDLRVVIEPAEPVNDLEVFVQKHFSPKDLP